MSTLQTGRYPVASAPEAAGGWVLTRLTAPSRLFGANGLRTGPDGRLYIAQVTGSQISALNVDTGDIETISAKGGDIVAPDDLAFGADGSLFATEVMDGRVSVRDSTGATRVLRDDMPSANGITVHQGRLFVNECREGGRLFEMDLAGGAPRLILADLPSPNAMEVGPDGLLYFPVMNANQIWRVHPDGGEPEVVAGDLGVPDSVKFDADGTIVSTQVASGQVLRIDPRTGSQTVLATLTPGLDNCAFVDGRLFVSNFTGAITEVTAGGDTRALLPGGLNWPLDVTVGADGVLYIADGTYLYSVGPDGGLRTVGMLFSPGYPGFVRGLTPGGAGEFVVTTSGGQVARYRPADNETDYLADGLDQLYGVTLLPDGTPVVVEQGTGRVLAITAGGDRGAGRRPGHPGRGHHRRRRLGVGVGDRRGAADHPVGHRHRRRRTAHPAGHPGARRRALYRRRRGQGPRRRRPCHRRAQHHRRGIAGRCTSRGHPEAAARNAAVLRAAGTVRRDRRGTRWHAVSFGRR